MNYYIDTKIIFNAFEVWCSDSVLTLTIMSLEMELSEMMGVTCIFAASMSSAGFESCP